MRLSIRMRVILALNAFVLCLALLFGWVAEEVAGQIVEVRFAREMVSRVSDFIVRNDFPRSQLMMRYLRDMFGADWVVIEGEPETIVASSLGPDQRAAFLGEIERVKDSGIVEMGGSRFRMDSAEFAASQIQSDHAGNARFYILVPYAVVQEARDLAAAKVKRVTWLAAGLATLLAFLLAISITRPIRRLAREMDDLAERGGLEDPAARAAPDGPLEVSQLTTSFHRLLDRLGQARAELARSERLATLGKVCLSVAHELRNPLSGIKMNVRLLKDDLDHDSEGHPEMETILREIDRMELYLSELINLSPDARPAPRELDPAQVRLSELADSVLGILSGRCRHAGVEVARDFPAGEPVVRVDPNQIRQAMMNLIVNAIEVMGSGGTITLTVRADPDTVSFAVADTGAGVQCEEGDIFDAFVSRKPNGVGLGLYLCKQIITRHGGSIDYENPPKGAVFRFVLPRHDGTEPATAATAATAATNESRDALRKEEEAAS